MDAPHPRNRVEFYEKKIQAYADKCKVELGAERVGGRMSEVRNSCDITAKSTAKPDNVSHPAHYTGGSIEAKDALKAAMDGSELSPMASYWWLRVRVLLALVSQERHEDLRKCRRCIDFLIEEVGE